MGQNEGAFTPWARNRENVDCLWETPPVVEPYTKDEMLEYIDLIDARVDETVDGLDLESTETGFPWYKNMGKLDHEIMSLRHVQGHIGQLSELLMAHGIDTAWVGRIKP